MALPHFASEPETPAVTFRSRFLCHLQGFAEGAMPGFLGSVSFSQRNLFGLNQKLSASAEVGQIDKTFKLSHHDPWVRGDPHHTSRTISIQNNRVVGTCVAGCVCINVHVSCSEENGLCCLAGCTLLPMLKHGIPHCNAVDAGGPACTGGNAKDTCSQPVLRETVECSRFDEPLSYTCLCPACAGNAIHGKAPDELGPQAAQGVQQEGNVMVGRVTGGVEYSRPLSTGWSGSLGLNWQRSGCMDDKGVPQTKASKLWVPSH